jgi:hypothetical protein
VVVTATCIPLETERCEVVALNLEVYIRIVMIHGTTTIGCVEVCSEVFVIETFQRTVARSASVRSGSVSYLFAVLVEDAELSKRPESPTGSPCCTTVEAFG